MIKPSEDNFVERLEAHPALKSRFQSILDLAENTGGDVIKAVEHRVYLYLNYAIILTASQNSVFITTK